MDVEIMNEDFYTCVLCGEKSIGWGNNPEPLASYDDGRCCERCNWEKVIPARIDRYGGLPKQEWSDARRDDDDDHDNDDDDQ
jgi:hypothetical protein